MRARDRSIQRRGRELIGLVTRHLPQEVDVTSDYDVWPLVSLALLSRMTTTLGSILDLQFAQREVDAGILLRSLYEHAVHFAWLAVDPGSRIEEWHKDDLVSRLKAEADARAHGVELLRDDVRFGFEAQVARMRGSALILTNLAFAADAHWTGALPAMRGRGEAMSFRGLYALLYRYYSGVAHPSMQGLNRVVDDLGGTRHRVRLESQYQGNGPYGLATMVFALALYVAANTIGWPRAPEIEAIFERYP